MILFLILINNINAKNLGVLKGIILDSTTNKPINYATVTILNQKDTSIVTGAISKDNGSFEIENIPFGKFNAKLSFIGYTNLVINNINFAPEKYEIDLGDVKLSPRTITQAPVEVTAERDMISYNIDKKVINVSQIIAARGGSAVDILQNVPGVSVDIEGNISLRGSSNFTVLIDGKPTVLSANEALKQIPADAIENIELITNPSAKYDPDGTSGIINIVLKKENYSGLSGMVNGSIGTRDKYTSDLLLNLKEGDFNIFAGVDLYQRNWHPTSKFVRETYIGDSTFFVIPTASRRMNPHGYTLKAGTDYYIDINNTLTLSGDFGNFGFDRYFPSNIVEYSEPYYGNQYYHISDIFLISGNSFSTNLNYQRKFERKGNEFNANIFYSNWNGTRGENASKYITNEIYQITDDNPKMNRSNEDSNKDNLRLKLDYTEPFDEKTKIEAGYQGDFVWNEVDFVYEDFDTSMNQWLNNNLYTNLMDFSSNIQSLYAIFSGEIFDIQYQLGLRAEYYNRSIAQKTTNESYNFDQFNLYPSVHITKQFPEQHQFMASYSRRINRPSERRLNPFPDYVDDYYISKGNPALEPEFYNSFELGYRKGFGASFVSLEGYYRQTDNLITRVLRLQPDNKLLMTHQNVGNDYSLGFELAGNIVLAQWLRLNASLDLYNYNFIESFENENIKRNKFVPELKFLTTIALSQSTFFQINGEYEGEEIVTDGVHKSSYEVGFSVRQDLFDKMLTIVLNGRDIFQTDKHEFINERINYRSSGGFYPESPIFTLSFHFKINNYQQKRKQQSDTINMEFDGGF